MNPKLLMARIKAIERKDICPRKIKTKTKSGAHRDDRHTGK